MNREGRILWGAILVFCATVAVAEAAERPPAKVVVDRVRETDVTQTFPVIGRFVAQQHGVVAALTNGPVEAVLADVGDRVAKGQVIGRLVADRIRANRDLQAAELREAQAALETAKAQLAFTTGEMARLDGLRKSAAFSQARYNDKRNEVAKFRSEVGEAEAAVARARANLELASIDLHNAEIRAPYDAVVVERHVVAGAHLAVGDPVMTLVNDRDMEVEAEVPADRLSGAEPGRAVTIRLDDGRRLEATIRAVVPSENAMTRTRPVRFSIGPGQLDGAGELLAANQSVTVLLPIATARRVVTVHKDAVTSRSGGRVVVVVDDGEARVRNIRIGEAIGDRFAVEFGLRAGDIVVIRGNEGLRPGQPVIYDEPVGESVEARRG